MRKLQALARVTGAVGVVAAFMPIATAISAVAAVRPQQAISLQASGPVTLATAGCAMGNGVQHVVDIFFDNVHYNRDNPNVPSDMEQLPALLNFIEDYGTFNSNEHTPLIAHTGDDSLTDYTGLYGDRQGQGVSNDYETYNPGNTSVDSAASFAYWTDPVDDTNGTPTPGHDADPSMMYSQDVPAQPVPNANGLDGDAETPAPWVPFTRAGCNVGEVASANMELENPYPDIPDFFGASSPEAAQLAADTSGAPYYDQEVADYIGVGVHCAQQAAFCSNATAVKYGQTTASNTAVNDPLPTEPGGYTGFQAVFGHKYLQPVLGPGAVNNGSTTTRTLPRATGPSFLPAPSGGTDTFPVMNSAGDLTDLFGNEMIGDYTSNPGFPGYAGITAAQSLAYTADMQESGVPVTYTYISDLHEKKYYPTGYKTFDGSTPTVPKCTTTEPNGGTPGTGYGLGPADPCYEFNAQQYNDAFEMFFQRLADDGITPANTEFVFAADEGDHFNGADVGRSITPTCTGTPGVAVDTATSGQTPYSCSYAKGTVGEVDTDIHGLLAAQQGDTTSSFYDEPQGNSVYVTSSSTNVRQLEHEFAAATVNDPFTGNANTPLSNYIADPEEEALLHFATADSLRTPSFTVFPESEVYMSSGTSDSCASGVTAANANVNCSYLDGEYLWNHGYYAPEIDTTWAGFVGPGVANNGLDGFQPQDGPNSAGPNSGSAQPVPTNLPGTWIDQADIRPTLMYLTGLTDDYTEDGRVITQDLEPSALNAAMKDPDFQPLGDCYKQLNASVGQFGNDTLAADTAAIESTSNGDSAYTNFEAQLTQLGNNRDELATDIKDDLWKAEFDGTPLPDASTELADCNSDLTAAAALEAGQGVGPALPESPLPVILPLLGVTLLGGVAFWYRRRRGMRPTGEVGL